MSNYNPYVIADSLANLQKSQYDVAQRGKDASLDVALHKGKMKEEYLEDIKRAEEEAIRLLNEQRKKKKGNWVLDLVKQVNPVVNAIVSGGKAMLEAKNTSKHMIDQATSAKEAALNIDPRWSKNWLANVKGGAKEYLGQADDYYGNILAEYKKAKPSLIDTLGIGMTKGAEAYSKGSPIKDIGKYLELGQNVAKGDFMEMPLKDTLIGPLKEGVPRFKSEGPGVGISEIAEKYGVSEDMISKLLGAKTPVIRSLFEGASAYGKKPKQNIFKGKEDFIKGLIKMLENIGVK